MATVTLPGSGKSFINITTGADASVALTSAIKSLFTAAGKNITANVVGSGQAGSAGFFNLIEESSSKNVSDTAGTGVQAIVNIGTGKDTLIGNASTTLLVANGAGDSISTAVTGSGVASVFGGAGDDTVSVTGNAKIYLGTGSNEVILSGSDSVSLLGTGGSDT